MEVETDKCVLMFFPNGSRGTISVNGVPCSAARAAWLISGRTLKSGELVRHKCNQGHRGCINLRHLEPGTPEENREDFLKIFETSPDQKIPGTKLSREDVWQIRKRANEFFWELAREFSVEALTIENVVKRKTWKNV